MSVGNNPDEHKISALNAIGYACEELDPENTPGVSDRVLTAVVNNLTNSNLQVVYAACKTLRSSLEFCKENFSKPEEKKYVFDALLNAITNTNVDVAVECFGILVDIVSLYYNEIESEMERIFRISLEAITDADEEIGKMAIEFWNSVCEEEILYNNQEIPHKNYALSALEVLVPILFKAITKQEPDYDPDEQNLPVSASVCLTYFGKAVRHHIVPVLLPLVEKYISSSNWNEQDAAILALAAILYAPGETINNLLTDSIPILINVLRSNPVDVVRDTSAWTIGQIFHMHPGYVKHLANDVLIVMGEIATTEVPRVAAQACWTIHAIAESYSGDPQNPVYNYYGDLIDCLLKAAERDDAGNFLLRVNAYETLNGLLHLCKEEHVESLRYLYNLVCEELAASVQKTKEIGSDPGLAEKQEMLCAMITVLAPTLPDSIKETHRPLMSVLRELLLSKNGKSVSAEVFLTITIVAQITDTGFMEHVPSTMELILEGISDIQNQKTCQYVTDLLSDMISLLGTGFQTYSDQIMSILFDNLGNSELDRSVKPKIFGVFGEMAMSLGEAFQRYLPSILNALLQAASDLASVDLEILDDDTLEYLDTLRIAIFGAFSSVMTEIKEQKKFQEIYNKLPELMELIKQTSNYKNSMEESHFTALVFLGDLLNKYQIEMRPYFSDHLYQYVQYCSKIKGTNIEEEAKTILDIIRRLKF